MSSRTSALSPLNTEQRKPTLAAFPKKTGFRTENIVLIILLSTSTRRLPLSLSFYFHFSLYPSQPLESESCRPQSWWLSLLHSVCHSIHSSEVDMLCFPSSMLVRSFTVNNISGTRHQPLLHAIRNLFVFVEYCHLLELYVKCAALYRTFIPQSFWNTRCGRPRGRKFHLTRSLVASEGWSLVRDRTNRKHCPSHEIWSYKRGGRWWGWSFDRGSTVMANVIVHFLHTFAVWLYLYSNMLCQ